MSHPTALVLGGGLAGIAAALRLREEGVDVRVVEPGRLGGLAQTLEPRPGWHVENKPHTFTGRADAVHALCTQLGLSPQVRPPGARYLVRNDRLRRPWTVLSWRVLRGLFRRVEDAPETSVRDWFAARMGTEFAEGPVAAMCTGIWGVDGARIEMASGFPRLFGAGTVWDARGGTGGTFTLPGGMGSIGEAARSVLGQQAVAETTARAVARDGEGWTAQTDHGDLHADNLVLAADAATVGAWLGVDLPVRYSALTVMHWRARDAAFPKGFGYLSEPASRREILGTLFGEGTYTSIFAGPASVSAVEAEHERLTGRPVTITDVHVREHPRAVAIPEPGHARRVAEVAVPDGVAVAGAWTGAGAMDDAVRSGWAAAARLVGGRRRRAA